jgi:hypothetical protein
MYEKKLWGLDIPELRDLNLCLLESWIKRYIADEGKLWRSSVDKKYCKGCSIFYIDKKQASPFWKGVILAAQAVKMGYR